jgi:hypothetical protein
VTTINFFLWGFVKDNVCFPPLPTTLHELKTRIIEVLANTDQVILHNVWQKVEYSVKNKRLESTFRIAQENPC